MKQRQGLGQTYYSRRKSKYNGVIWKARYQKREASYQLNGIIHQCGFWDDEISAVRARDKTIIRVGGDLKKLQILKPKTSNQ